MYNMKLDLRAKRWARAGSRGTLARWAECCRSGLSSQNQDKWQTSTNPARKHNNTAFIETAYDWKMTFCKVVQTWLLWWMLRAKLSRSEAYLEELYGWVPFWCCRSSRLKAERWALLLEVQMSCEVWPARHSTGSSCLTWAIWMIRRWEDIKQHTLK